MPRRHISKIAAIAIIAIAATFSTPKPAEANIGALLALLKEAASYHIGGFKFVVPWDASSKILHLCAKSPGHCSVTAKPVPHRYERSTGAKIGPYVVGCIFGNAASLIGAAAYVGNKFNRELTQQEAQIIAFSPCGVGVVYVLSRLPK
jgi:hypothetical protein